MAHTIPWQLIGARVSGDLDGYTIYTDKHGRKIVYPISPPDKPPSQAQIARRTRFTAAQRAWSSLTATEKEALEVCCRISNAPITGQNLYIRVALTGNTDLLATLARQTGIPLPAIPHIP